MNQIHCSFKNIIAHVFKHQWALHALGLIIGMHFQGKIRACGGWVGWFWVQKHYFVAMFISCHFASIYWVGNWHNIMFQFIILSSFINLPPPSAGLCCLEWPWLILWLGGCSRLHQRLPNPKWDCVQQCYWVAMHQQSACEALGFSTILFWVGFPSEFGIVCGNLCPNAANYG